MAHSHADYTEGCFACKLRTLQWGMVPGGYRASNSVTNYDEATLPDFPTKEEVMDTRSDFRRLPTRELTRAEAERLAEVSGGPDSA